MPIKSKIWTKRIVLFYRENLMLGIGDPLTITLLLSAAIFAGFVDSIIGGGGLILIPALLLGLPSLPPSVALGTNKTAAVCGTLLAAITYQRKIPTPLTQLLSLGIPAILFSALGALATLKIDANILRPIILFAIIIIGLFLIFKPEFGKDDFDYPISKRQLLLFLIIISAIGFYDGFFGPGTGMFLVLALSGIGSQSFLKATSFAKVINTATNIGALFIFAIHGSILWKLAIPLAIANMAGSFLGSHLVLARGTRLIRAAMLVLIFVLVIKLGLQELGIS
ncbi:MAG: TSUP family transporter [Mobiluncus porci]|uniref:sulfite exporter TauE/SafE family protein n=1 Tax=Mobiluncus porci TaxID=2652278 RepID=UPI0023F1449C|nr:TSUP family transporter [Mobiluncus porci]MDD7542261.1 TSUP family transporter [Mobiluncus porci]MDY5749060.1 TSUP family transporter [Mobiluncus porci]